MAWNPDVSRQLHVAFHESNDAEFKRLLTDHPEHLRDEDGSDVWMWKAAMDHKLPILQALVTLGVDVNESHDRGDESDPFFEPEGPILQAAGNGDVDMVRWLLDNGAQINYTVKGKPRCLPLIHAASEGHFDVVQLLVQRGADIGSTWEGLNAISQAERMGHLGIRDYLKKIMNAE
jgi:ankyrin repeat protein